MSIDPNTFLLSDVEYIVSPNCDEFPDQDDISLLVIHSISLPPGEFGSDDVSRLFTNQIDPNAHPYFKALADIKVSAHAFIRRDGRVLQFVPFNKRAWHAGQSVFAGRAACNDFSIGIELEGTDTGEFSVAQYQSLATVTQQLLKIYPKITRERIVGHSDVAPKRKTDPGLGFSWEKYLALLD